MIGDEGSGHHAAMTSAAAGPSPVHDISPPLPSARAASVDHSADDRARPEGTLLEELVLQHLDFVWRLLRRLGLDPADAEDATQQVLLTVGPAKIPLAADDLGGKRAQPPELVELLADQVEQWAPQKVSVVRELRQLASGRPPGRSRR